MAIYDYLVIGSGCSGAIAAQTLVEGGVKVAMLDAGMKNDENINIPDEDFIDLRKSDSNQHNYLIGKNAESVVWGKVGKGEQITPPRKHILSQTDKYIPTESTSFAAFESLGYGGNGIGWGLQCWEYSKAEIKAIGIDYNDMVKAYQVVGDRIGISGTNDEAAKYTLGSLSNYQPSPKMNKVQSNIYRRYLAKKDELKKEGVYMGRTPLALITKDKDNRKAYSYHDMDFYSDNDLSAWRPWILVDELRKKSNFSYIGGYLVTSFSEKDDIVTVNCIQIGTNKKAQFGCRHLILASGALGTARIVLRSLGNSDVQLPVLSNPYSYIPCLQPRMVGKEAERQQIGFGQLSMFVNEKPNTLSGSVASLYSYHSLMLFRIIRHVPLNFVDSRILMRYLMSGLVIMGVQYPDKITDSKYVKLVKNDSTPTGDTLHINYELSKEEKSQHRKNENKYVKLMRSIGVYSLKRMNPGYGSSIHYAGTLPFSKKQQPNTLDPSGRLHGTKHVYVADSSGFNFLPAKGLTFTLMANAHLVAERILNA